MTFKEFVKALNILCEEELGVGLDCLPDMPTRDWYDSYGFEEYGADEFDEMEEVNDIMDELRERADYYQ